MPTASPYPPPQNHQNGNSPLLRPMGAAMAARYTPIEVLLLFHNMAVIGANPNAFDAISNIFASNPLFLSGNFDREKHTPEALKELFVYHLRQSEANITSLDARALNELIRVVAKKVYEDYKRYMHDAIKLDEQRLSAIEDEIKEIKGGVWDSRLLAEAERKSKLTARTPAPRTPLPPYHSTPQAPIPALRTAGPLPQQAHLISTPGYQPQQNSPLFKHAPAPPGPTPPPGVPHTSVGSQQHRLPPAASAPIPSPQVSAPAPVPIPHTPTPAASAPSPAPPVRGWPSPSPGLEQGRQRPPGNITLPLSNPPRPNIPAPQFSPVLPQPQSPSVTSGPYVPITPTSRTPAIPPLPAPYRIAPPQQSTQPAHHSPLNPRPNPLDAITSTPIRPQTSAVAPSTPAPISIPPVPPYRPPMSGTSPSAMYHPAIPTLNPPYMRNPAVDRTPRRPSRVNTPVAATPTAGLPASAHHATPSVAMATPTPFITPRIPSPKPFTPAKPTPDEVPRSPKQPSAEDISPISTPPNSPKLSSSNRPSVLDTPGATAPVAPPSTPFVSTPLSLEERSAMSKALVARLLAQSRKAAPYLKTKPEYLGGISKRTGRVGAKSTPQPNVRTRRSASAEAEPKPVDTVDVMEGIAESPAPKPKPAEDVEMSESAPERVAEDVQEEPEETGRTTRSTRTTRARTTSQRGSRVGSRRRTPRAETPATDEESVRTGGERQKSAAPTIPEDTEMADAARQTTPTPKTEPSDSNALGMEIPEAPSPHPPAVPKNEASGASHGATPSTDAVIAGQQPYIFATKKFPQLSAPLLANISGHKFASLFSNPVSERSAPGYHGLVYRPQDLKSIKSAIKAGGSTLTATTEVSTPSGAAGAASSSSFSIVPATTLNTPPKGIVNSAQLEKELFRMFANACMYNKSSSEVAKETLEMAKEVERHVLEFRNAERLGEQGRRREAEKHKITDDRARSLTKAGDDDSRGEKEGTVDSSVAGDDNVDQGRRGGAFKRGKRKAR